MDKDSDREIAEIETELNVLPHWSIVKKNVNGKVYHYRRVRIDGKYKDIYIEPELVESERALVSRRMELEKRLKALKLEKLKSCSDSGKYRSVFRTRVVCGEALRELVAGTKDLKRRFCIGELKSYLYGKERGKVFILYGLRRTGKTTLMYQAIADMDEETLSKTAFIQVKEGDRLSDVDADMSGLKDMGFKYVFIDEATFMDDFIRGAEVFSDFYAAVGMKVVLTGTDSLGFKIASEERLFDRSRMQRTTFIPFREFESVLGETDMDEYISRGGTLSVSGKNYNEGYNFPDGETVNAYLNSSIAFNIQNSLKNYEYGGRFRNLTDLYRGGELTGAINRIVENINHEFAVEVLTKDFDSRDFDQLANDVRLDQHHGSALLDTIDRERFNDCLRHRLSILNRGEQKITITEDHVREIREYLLLLNFIYEIELVDYGASKQGGPLTVVSQPGLRFAQAEAFVDGLSEEDVIKNLPSDSRRILLDRARNVVRGGIMEEIVQLETKLARPDKRVFKLRFETGEIDMVVEDRKEGGCSLYEIKHSVRTSPEQRKNLKSADKCAKIEYSYGPINGKYVIYRGRDMDEGGVRYLNVENYLRSLDTDTR